MINTHRRINLNKETQKGLFKKFKSRNITSKKLAMILNIPYSTLKKYSTAKRTIPENVFLKVLDILKIEKNELTFSYLHYNWGRVLGSTKGMNALERKYPSKIILWRKQAIRNSAKKRCKNINIPDLDNELAEFIGIYLGDGYLTKYFIKISGDYRFDLPYYNYITNLTRKLFNIQTIVKKDKRSNAVYLYIYSKELCSFLNKKYNLKYGNKMTNNSLIPEEILAKNHLALSCLRGLIDTDGSVSRRGREGKQFTITFFSKNINLVEQVRKISEKNSLFSFISKIGDTIGTNRSSLILKYFKIVGSSNLRHIVRFYERVYHNNTLYQKEVLSYYGKDLYMNISLPYKSALLSIG
ncbi:MAG: LAGLIDADG family homing endonuclease [Nanoarchaeota archaeon]